MITVYGRNRNLIYTSLCGNLWGDIYLENPYSGLGTANWQCFSLDTINVLHDVQCTACCMIYVGEAGNSSRIGM